MSYKKIILEKYYLEQSQKKINNKISKLQNTLKLKKEKKKVKQDNLNKARQLYKEKRDKAKNEENTI
jgi:hypothetical protein|tara:strand:+ start:131 stop:331 length:201 start_codon:yes stop_codon:yes gene_type:complete